MLNEHNEGEVNVDREIALTSYCHITSGVLKVPLQDSTIKDTLGEESVHSGHRPRPVQDILSRPTGTKFSGPIA